MQQTWIEVEEALPGIGKWCDVRFSGGPTVIRARLKSLPPDGELVWQSAPNYHVFRVSHWRYSADGSEEISSSPGRPTNS